MKTLKFKSTINCDGCISKVKPILDGHKKIEKWEVDTAHKDKILTVHSDSILADEVSQALLEIGFKAEEVDA
ncbi:MAG: hypothetical protein L0J45_01065 [Psychroflexus sp.]|nr:hypothetical protein [Psychroflexus sp.]MDN6310117.1 hypothetical protein [Psychroflexus sp.]